MTTTTTPGPAPDWPHLWQLTSRWAARPFAGVVLAPEAQAAVARSVFEDFLKTFSEIPAKAEFLGYLQKQAQQQAISLTAQQRQEQKQPDLWHDPGWQPGEPVLDMTALRQRDSRGGYSSPEWQRLHDVLKRRALRIIPGMRAGSLAIPDSAVDDVFMASLTELIRDRPGKGPLLDELPLWEHVTAVFNTIAKREGIEWLRREGRRKNQPNASNNQTSFDDPDAGLSETHADPSSTQAVVNEWHGVTFERIHKGCSGCLTPLQWKLIIAIYVEETATRLDLASDPEVLRDAGVAPSASESTRRRAVNAQLEAAIAHLARCLQTHDI